MGLTLSATVDIVAVHMTRRNLALALSLTFLLSMSVAAQRGGSIEGRVVSQNSNDPVRGASVILNTDPISDTPLVGMSDDNGRFEFRDVATGKYQLLASKDGYVRSAIPIAVADGQSLKALTAIVTPMGAIAGIVRNQMGEPVANVEVRALKVVYQDGRKSLSSVQRVLTNDLGEYRLYYLEPGKYAVSATPAEGPIPVAGSNGQIARLNTVPGTAFGGAVPGGVTTGASSYTSQGILSAAETGVTYVPLYFPGVSDLAQATIIDLQPTATFKGADFVVSEVRPARIRGQIRDAATGLPVKGTNVVLVTPGDTPAAFDRYGATTDSGDVDFRAIPPGSYELIASSGAMPNGTPFSLPRTPGAVFIDRSPTVTPSSGVDTRMLARVLLHVAGTGVENLALNLRPGFQVKGSISFEGASFADLLSGLSVQLIPPGPLQADDDSDAVRLRRVRSYSMPGAVGPDGAFTISGVFSGTYRIAIRGAAKLPIGVYVRSARLESVDALSPRLSLVNEPTGRLEIVLGANPGKLQVAVTNDGQTPASAVTVVLVPDAEQRQRYELYFKSSTDSTGKAQFENIPPGDYQAYAWKSIEEGIWWDPEFLRKFEGQGRAVRIEPLGAHNAELKSIQ